jgi:type II secretory pathway pseudopilin PulG
MKIQQRGFSLIGLLFVGVILAFGGLVGAQVVPTLIEYQAITKAVNKVAAQGGTVAEIRNNFEKAQNVEDFKAINGKDLEISKNGDKVQVSFAYQKEIHLGGPAYLLLKYAGTSK